METCRRVSILPAIVCSRRPGSRKHSLARVLDNAYHFCFISTPVKEKKEKDTYMYIGLLLHGAIVPT